SCLSHAPAPSEISPLSYTTLFRSRRIRVRGAPNAVIAHDPKGQFDIPALLKRAQDWPGLEGMDLARRVSREKHEGWEGGPWRLRSESTRLNSSHVKISYAVFCLKK